MKHPHTLPRTTHTVEIEQLAELNERLKVRGNEQRITAADLDLDRAPVWSTATGVVPTLAADSILERLCYDGPPDFPYIHAHFMTSVAESPPQSWTYTATHCVN